MQPLRLGRWGSSILPLGARSCSAHSPCPRGYSIRFQTTTTLRPPEEGAPIKKRRGRPPKGETAARPPRRTTATTASSSTATPVPAEAPSEPPLPPPTSQMTSDPTETPKTSPFPSEPPRESHKPGPNILKTDEDPPKQFKTAAAEAHASVASQPSSRQTLTREASFPPQPTKPTSNTLTQHLSTLPSPPPLRARKSAKLSALHARLRLPTNLPLETLFRCLVDKTADPDSRFNNHNLAVLGNDLLGYYATEYLICHFPRLPQVVLEAAVSAYVGPKALGSIAQGWGIEAAAEPGGEVDPGFLQFRRVSPSRRDARTAQGMKELAEERSGTFNPKTLTLDHAAAFAVRAVFASVYLHSGAAKVKEFFQNHVLSRQLEVSSLFTFTKPTNDLSRLCAREGFEPPIARLISETGRKSSAPVFVVGVYSGHDKIGEDAGASLDEARWKAAAKALKGWYLYSPKGREVMLPSMMEGEAGRNRVWKKPYIDDGEVIV